MRENNPIEDIVEQIKALKISQANLEAENIRLRNRIEQLESNASIQQQQNTIWIESGDRVSVHRPTTPASLNREIISSDRVGAVDFARDVWVCFTADSGTQRYRKPNNLTIIRNDP